MKFVPRKELAQWHTEAYGGEWNFHADMIADVGETPMEAMVAALRGSLYFYTPLPHGATMHFKFSINDSEIVADSGVVAVCGKCGAPSEGPHSCPYEADINDNDDPECCTCCDACTQECADDI